MSTPVKAPTVVIDQTVAGRVTLNGVRLSYANLDKPTAAQAGGEARFSTNVLIPTAEAQVLQQLQAVMWQLVQATFGAQAQGVWAEMGAGGRLALKDGALKASTDGYLGNHFISLSAKADRPPALFDLYLDQQTGRPRVLSRPQTRLYSGCYANVQFKFWVQNNQYGKRVNAELLAVQFAADGEAFGGGSSAPDLSVFGGVQEPVGALPTDAAAPGFAAPPAAPGFAAPPAAPGFAAPPAAPGFAAPPTFNAPTDNPF